MANFRREQNMRRFAVLFVALLLVGVVGCDGDGGGAAVDSEEPSTDVPDPGPEGIILAEGRQTIPAPAGVLKIPFTVGETGTLEGRLIWSDEPATLQASFVICGTTLVKHETGSSPFFISADVTQDLLNIESSWILYVDNPDPDPVEVEYRLEFTPN